MVDRESDSLRRNRQPDASEQDHENSVPGYEQGQIDVNQLAERVYKLMRDDLRLERARRGLN